jgi:hypothetical protein
MTASTPFAQDTNFSRFVVSLSTTFAPRESKRLVSQSGYIDFNRFSTDASIGLEARLKFANNPIFLPARVFSLGEIPRGGIGSASAHGLRTLN